MQFLTIKQEARQGIVAEWRLRQMLKQNRLPGYYAGTRFYINHTMLMEQIERECLMNATEAARV